MPKPRAPKKKPVIDFVNHAPHYNFTTIQPIDVIEAFDLGFHLGNVTKYVLRHTHKNGLEDLRKARWYLNRYIAKLESVEAKGRDRS